MGEWANASSKSFLHAMPDPMRTIVFVDLMTSWQMACR